MAKPMYYWNGTAWEAVAPVVPQSPIAYQASAPSSPSTGDLWIDSDQDLDSYQRQLVRYRFNPSAGATSVSGVDANGATLSYTPGAEQVYLNGALLVRGSDYVATNGTSITSLAALSSGDVVEIFAYVAFNPANTYTQSQVDGLIGGTGTLSGAWTSFTPSWTNLTVGNGTVNATYKQIGKTVIYQILLTFGSTTSISGNVSFTFPVTSKTSETHNGNVVFNDAGTNWYIGMMTDTNTTTASIAAINTGGTYGSQSTLSSTVPFTWTTNDKIKISGTYEAA